MIRWIFTKENWFARWWRVDFIKVEPLNPRIPRKIQERINEAEFDMIHYGKDPIPEYEKIYKELTEKR